MAGGIKAISASLLIYPLLDLSGDNKSCVFLARMLVKLAVLSRNQAAHDDFFDNQLGQSQLSCELSRAGIADATLGTRYAVSYQWPDHRPLLIP